MRNIHLTMALGEYDHARDLLDGTVNVEGVDLTVLRLEVEEIFYRFTLHREWDVSEMSFAKLVALASQDDTSLVPIPVFVSRAFRHSSLYVRADSPITKPEQLSGKRVGVPEWAQTAAIYSRGMLAHEYGVDLKSIHWHQAGVNQAGRVEKVKLSLPEGLRYTQVPDRSLTDMLLAGDLDAVLTARPPAPYSAGDGRLRRVFEDYRSVELDYWRKTGIFPIMHTVAIRRDVYERHRWVAMNLFKAFEEAKNRSLARVRDITVSFFPLPWTRDMADVPRSVMGDDFWPYGIEPNRTTLEAFLQYAFEQGVCRRKLDVDQLFAPEVRSKFKV
ncbi:MAG TPA: 4,5-dihydroxyphthalate decarboxylase [Beijerinckiaceae bacterium]|jgi:4,5-dihydroxyphthalate decarboxylase